MAQTQEELHCRPPMEHMLGIHEQLQAGRFPNCTKLANQFEVTPRTIMRDIDFMKCRLNLPIEYNDARYGYYDAACHPERYRALENARFLGLINGSAVNAD